MANNQDIDIVVRVDAAQANATLKTTEENVKNVGVAADGATSGVSSFQSGIVSAGAAGLIAAGAIAGLAAAIYGMRKGIERGDVAGDLSRSFQNLANSAGVAGDAVLSRFGKSLDYTVSKVDQMRSANDLMLAGIDPNKFEIIGRAARSLGEATGKDAAQGLDMMTNALIRGQVELLRHAGIFVDGKTAIINYAFAHKEAAQSAQEFISAMGEEEKASVVQGAIFEALAEKQMLVGSATVSTGEAIKQLGNVWNHAVTEIWIAVEANKDLGDALLGISAVARSINMSSFINYLGRVKDIVLKLNPALESTLKLLAMFKDYGANEGAGRGALVGLIDDETQGRNKLADAIKKNIAEAKEAVARLKDDTVAHGVATKARAASTAAIDKEAAAFESLKDKIDDIAVSPAIRELEAPMLEAMLEDPLKDSQDLEIEIGLIVDRLHQAGASTDDLAAAFREASKDAASVKVGSIPSGGAPGGTSDSSSGAATGWGSSFNMSSDQEAGFNQVGSKIGGQIMAGITDYFANKAGEEYAKNGEMIGGGIGSAIGAYFGGAAGAQIGGQIGGVIGVMIASVFAGGKKEQEKKTIDAYFGDIFNANRITTIVEGQMGLVRENFAIIEKFIPAHMATIDDLQFNNPNMQQHWDELSADAKNSFQAIGDAWEQLLIDAGIDVDMWAGELGKVFNQNLGGDIGNLRMLLKAAGKDAAELGNALMKAFLQGKMSAEAYMKELQAIASVMDKSVSRAVDNVGKEWENVIAAGWSGGAALLSSISDIGAAAYQLGARTFPELANIMINSFGIGADKVTQFMQAMAMAGINSLEALATASDEVLTAIAANMESLSSGGTGGYKPIDLNLDKNVGGSSRPTGGGVSSGESAADKAKKILDEKISKLKSTESAIRDVLLASNEWAKIEDDLKNKIIDSSGAETARLALRAKIKAAIDEVRKAEKQLDADAAKQAKGKKVSVELILQHEAALKKAKDALDEFTKSEDEAADSTINLGTVISGNLMDIIDAIGKQGGNSGGDAALDFFKNFTGTVNELGVAIGSLSDLFGNMQQSAIDAFNAGQISAKEAWKAINNNGVGSSSEAYKNFKEYGTKGGRFSIDAIRDMAKEAQKAGGKTLGDLYHDLLIGGADMREIDKMFQQFQDAGVTSLEGLASVSDEAAIHIISDLSDLKFPFGETKDSITQLLDQLDKLQTGEKRIKVVLDVSTNYTDAPAKDIADKVGVPYTTPPPRPYSAGAPGLR